MKGLVVKLFLTALITVTWYTVTVFSAPEISTKIDALIGLDGLSEKILSLKSWYDSAITDIPSLDEVKSGATDFSEKFTDGLDITKQKIDEVRSGAQKVEDTYNQTMDTIDSVKESLSGAQDLIQSVSETASQIQSFSSTMSASGSLSGSTEVSE